MKRREMLAVGSGMLGLGIGSLLGFGLSNRKAEAADVSVNDPSIWKFAKIDPMKAAHLAYELYPDGDCMYAIVRGLITTIADALRSSDPLAASMMMGFPFHMTKYGNGGISGIGSACGAFNGGAAVIALYVHDTDRRVAMTRELNVYYEHEELPKYLPRDGHFPSMPKSVAESNLCHVSSSRWQVIMDIPISDRRRIERCRRLTADITIKTAELLSRYFADRNTTFAPLMQPTATCFSCHGSQGPRRNIIGTASCATCHQNDETHIDRNRFLFNRQQ